MGVVTPRIHLVGPWSSNGNGFEGCRGPIANTCLGDGTYLAGGLAWWASFLTAV